MKNKLFHGVNCICISLVVLLSNSHEIVAQTDSLPNPEQFLFREFSAGTVVPKTGSRLTLILNYSIVTEKMVFIQRRKIYELINPGSVDTIYLQNRKFVPVGKSFYEVLSETPVLLFVQHKGDVQQPVKTDPYGRSSQASATTSVYNMKVSNIFYTLSDPDVVIKQEKIYWVSVNNSQMSFKDATQLLKIFPELKIEIRTYIKQNNTKFGKTDDILKLITYCNSLIK